MDTGITRGVLVLAVRDLARDPLVSQGHSEVSPGE
jgi:hypothetical protein